MFYSRKIKSKTIVTLGEIFKTNVNFKITDRGIIYTTYDYRRFGRESHAITPIYITQTL